MYARWDDMGEISGCSNVNLSIALFKKKFVRHENENIKATKSQKINETEKEMQKLSAKLFECSDLNLPRVKFDLTL